MKRFAMLACGALAVAVQSVAVAATTTRSNPRLAHEMLGIINRDRAAVHLSPLLMDARTSRVAAAHSVDMATHHRLSHFSMSGVSPFERLQLAGIRYRAAGENVGVDMGSDALSMLRTVETIMLDSPPHRANLLSPAFHSIGIGVAINNGALYVTEDFTG